VDFSQKIPLIICDACKKAARAGNEQLCLLGKCWINLVRARIPSNSATNIPEDRTTPRSR